MSQATPAAASVEVSFDLYLEILGPLSDGTQDISVALAPATSAPSGKPMRARADGRGRLAFTGLAAGRYDVSLDGAGGRLGLDVRNS